VTNIQIAVPSVFDKVAIITGGSKGIGAGCARVFVAAGASVVICGRGSEAGETLAHELSGQRPDACHYEACQVAQPEDLKRVVESTVERYGRLDCLINNAGWHPDHRPIDDFSIEEFESLLRLNLVSYFAGCKYALPYLRQTHGSIINISSLVGQMGQEWATTYVATKGAITAFTKALAVDEARHGVRVNAVLPGNIATPLFDTFIESKESPQQVQDHVDSLQWAGRMGTADEVGQVCLFLASDQASFVTGVELIVSGGAELAYGIKWPKQGRVQM
jgi:NAD(P)-dependent dehydrogenase (short-subunit alcohol dehydrogenase family)